jgi:hypothetical protein
MILSSKTESSKKDNIIDIQEIYFQVEEEITTSKLMSIYFDILIHIRFIPYHQFYLSKMTH